MNKTLRWLPLSILGAAAGVLGALWQYLPRRWPIHWGLDGHADGWVTRTPIGVFGPLLIALVLWLGIEGMFSLIRTNQLRHDDASAIIDALRVTEIALALTFAFVAIWMPFGRPDSPLGMIVVSLGIVLTGVIVSMLRFSKLRSAVIDAALTSDEGWKGSIYRNPKDQRLWVAKRSGLGWTINFAHPLAWPALILLLLPAIISLGAGVVIFVRSR